MSQKLVRMQVYTLFTFTLSFCAQACWWPRRATRCSLLTVHMYMVVLGGNLSICWYFEAAQWDVSVKLPCIYSKFSTFSPVPAMFGNEDEVPLGPSLWQDDYYQNWILHHCTVSDSHDRTCTTDTTHIANRPSALLSAQTGTHSPDYHHC